MAPKAKVDHALPTGGVSLSPIGILNAARKAVPAVDYALGAAGIAAAGSIVVGLLGNGRAAIIIVGGMFVAMVLLFAFARLVAAQSPAIVQAGIALLWMVVLFFGIFLFFTTTAVAFGWPFAWAQVLGLEDQTGFNREAMEKLLEVPKEISNRFNSQASVGLVRIQPRLSDLAEFAKREAVLSGGGAYYSFVSGSHDYQSGADIELEPGLFKTGFAGADYGFFMYTGEGTSDELAALKQGNFPTSMDSSREDAWKYMWTYKPPSDIKAIRAQQKQSRGFAISGVTLSDQIAVNKEGLYLLRSILIARSDCLIGFYVADTLSDGSVILAWRVLSVFDTPIATGNED